MKRAALLILVVGAPLVLLFFPEFRRRIARKMRFLLLLWAGSVLCIGLITAGKGALLEGRSTVEAVFAAAGVALFAAAFFSILRDSR
jgi:hypothetical protein